MLPVTGIGNEAEEKPTFTGQHSLAPSAERKIPLNPPEGTVEKPWKPKQEDGCQSMCTTLWQGGMRGAGWCRG